jgi:hypothetical protein
MGHIAAEPKNDHAWETIVSATSQRLTATLQQRYTKDYKIEYRVITSADAPCDGCQGHRDEAMEFFAGVLGIEVNCGQCRTTQSQDLANNWFVGVL